MRRFQMTIGLFSLFAPLVLAGPASAEHLTPLVEACQQGYSDGPECDRLFGAAFKECAEIENQQSCFITGYMISHGYVPPIYRQAQVEPAPARPQFESQQPQQQYWSGNPLRGQEGTVESTKDYARSKCSDPALAAQLRAFGFCK